MPFEIATMSFTKRETTVTHTLKTKSQPNWVTIEVWSPGANKFVRSERWEFTNPPTEAGNKHQTKLTLKPVATPADAADDEDIKRSRGMQMTLRVGFGNNRNEPLYLNLTP